MPALRCPSCDRWAAREQWRDAPGQRFPFAIVCPSCGRRADVGEPEYRLYVPDEDLRSS